MTLAVLSGIDPARIDYRDGCYPQPILSGPTNAGILKTQLNFSAPEYAYVPSRCVTQGLPAYA